MPQNCAPASFSWPFVHVPLTTAPDFETTSSKQAESTVLARHWGPYEVSNPPPVITNQSPSALSQHETPPRLPQHSKRGLPLGRVPISKDGSEGPREGPVRGTWLL